MYSCNKSCPVWEECGYPFKGKCDCVNQRKFKPLAVEKPLPADIRKRVSLQEIGASRETINYRIIDNALHREEDGRLCLESTCEIIEGKFKGCVFFLKQFAREW